jgi:hypothetical protein
MSEDRESNETTPHPFDPDRLKAHRNKARRTEVDPELRRAWLRLSKAIRGALRASVELDAPAVAVSALAAQAEALEEQVEKLAGGRQIPLYGAEPEDAPENIGATMPFSPIAGRYNPAAPPVSFRVEGERVIGEVCYSSVYQGAPGLVHGAVISATYDELLAMANLAQKTSGPTARLTVRYRQPTPIETELRYEAWVDQSKERYVLTRGRCYAGETLVSDAEGIFVRIARAGQVDSI